MVKVRNIIEKIKRLNILEIILILSPTLDILTAISERNIFYINFSFGIAVRAFLMFFMVMYTFFKSKYKHKKISILYLIATFIYFVIFTVIMYTTKGIENVVFEVKGLIKAFYFPICFVTILNYLNTKKYNLNKKILFIVMVQYIALLFIPYIFNIGYDSYHEDKIGTIGWYYSSNEISSIFAILFPIILCSDKKNKYLYMFVVMFCIFTMFQIGTKIPSISVGFSLLYILIFNIVKMTKQKKGISNVLRTVFLLMYFLIVLFYSPVYKNYIIYRDYLIETRDNNKNIENERIENDEEKKIKNDENEEIENVVEFNLNNIVELKCNEPENITSSDKTLTSEEISTIIQSGRLETLKKLYKNFKKLPNLNKILGVGKKDIESQSEYLTEIDYFDIFFNFGLIGFVIYFLPIIIYGIYLLKQIKEIFLCEEKLPYLLGCGIGLFLCAVSGHTFVAPAVSIYIVIILIKLNEKELKKEKLEDENNNFSPSFRIWRHRKIYN